MLSVVCRPRGPNSSGYCKILARSVRRISCSHQVPDHRNRIRSGPINFTRGLYCDAAYGDKWFSRDLPGRAQKFKSDHRVGICLCPGREDGSHRNIVRRSRLRRAQLLQSVCRNPYPQRSAAYFSRFIHGKIFLSHMNPACAGHGGNVGAIVHNHANALRSKPGGERL